MKESCSYPSVLSVRFIPTYGLHLKFCGYFCVLSVTPT